MFNQPNTENAPRSKALLDKVFDRLDAVDVNALPTTDLKDFLEVVQKCQFLEGFGKMPALGYGFNSFCAAPSRDNPSYDKKDPEAEGESV